jgi:hypothetical protein
MALPTPTISYLFDGNALHSTYGVYVSGTKGILDLPKMKVPQRYSWPDLPGESVDLVSPQYDVKEFSLDCWMQATSILDFTTKLNSFIKALISPVANTGTHRLQINIDSSTVLLYQVYCADGLAANIRFKADAQIGTFTVRFREPEPMKRIYKHTVPSYSLSITIVASKSLNVYWGDGTMSADLAPDITNVVSRFYGSTGVKYIIITGDIDSISYISTTATILWDKLL